MRDRFTHRQRHTSALSFEGNTTWYDVELLPEGVLLRADVPLPAARPVRGTLKLGAHDLPFEAELAWVQPGSKWLGSASVIALRFTRIDARYFTGQASPAAA